MLFVSLLTTTGCWRPDESASPTDKLVGYWEVTHYSESDKGYTIEADGSTSPYNFYEEYDVHCDDGHVVWNIFHFSDAYITLIATDDPDMATVLNIPVSYARTGNTLTSLFFEGDLNNEVVIDFDGDDILYLDKIEQGFLFDNDLGYNTEYMDYSCRLTLRRINNN